ncbi:MAG: YHYH protein [Pirellulales bacterium]
MQQKSSIHIWGKQFLKALTWIAVSALQPSTASAQELLPASLQRLSLQTQAPIEIQLQGDAVFSALGDQRRELNGFGIVFDAANDRNNDSHRSGSVALDAKVSQQNGRWFRFRIRGLAQPGFAVDQDDLWLNVDFFRDGGTNSLDHIRQRFYERVELDRKSLADKGRNTKLDEAVWRSYEMVFRTPYAEVDKLTLTVGYDHGKTNSSKSQFWINEISLQAIPVPDSYEAPQPPAPGRPKSELAKMIPLGGRWYYDPKDSSDKPPEQYDYTNGHRLYYLTDKLEAPFADNMTAWRRKGYLDVDGNAIQQDEFVTDNVLVMFTGKHLNIRSRNLPNHPTAVFPDRSRGLDGNPNYIQERISTTRIPLEPQENPNRKAMAGGTNENSALPKGPVGIAVNGIVFFNPFDHLQTEDAIWRLDRCCGHPAPDYQYHYHKYPVCVKSPWSDDGAGHSPLIGFAADGYPIFGPYESQGKLAKDDTDNSLNEYNVHFDNQRGWHYHVTPGKFPHIIGGYWGVAESRRRGPGGAGPGGAGPGGAGPGGPGPGRPGPRGAGLDDRRPPNRPPRP